MTYLVICGVALLASGLTFFSGFGLGTMAGVRPVVAGVRFAVAVGLVGGFP